MFGVINGKKFNAPQVPSPDGIDHYVDVDLLGPSPGLDFDFTGLIGEAVGPSRHRHAKHNFKLFFFGCTDFNGQPLHPPQDLACGLASYSESKPPRKIWNASLALTSPPSVTVHIESIEGDWVRGSFSGFLDDPLPDTAASGTVTIQSLHFYIKLVRNYLSASAE